MTTQYKSDNTNIPDPTNFIEYLKMLWNNHFDNEYQESKKRYEKFKKNKEMADALRMSKSDKAKQFTELKKSVKKMKTEGQSAMKPKV